MPWEHCGETILDDKACPGCKITKEAWTMEWNVTRTFQIQKGAKGLKLILHDADDEPIPNAAYEAELPDGTKLQGTLDKHGAAKIDTQGAKGACKVTFPGVKPEVWVRQGKAQAQPKAT